MNTEKTLDAETVIWFGDQSIARPFKLTKQHIVTPFNDIVGAYSIEFGEHVQTICYLNEQDANNNIKRIAHYKLEKNLEAFNQFKEHQRKEFEKFFEQYSEAFNDNNNLIKTIDNQDKCQYTVNYSNFIKFSRKHLTLEYALKEADYCNWSKLAIPISIFENDTEIWNHKGNISLSEMLEIIEDNKDENK